MPGGSVKDWDTYHALRKRNYGKGAAARIANAQSAKVAKVTKEKVNYRPATGSSRCRVCRSYRAGKCSRVAGRISPSNVCDLFRRKT